MSELYALRAFRKNQDLSQSELADLLGVTRETVNRWETGNRKIDEQRLPLVSEKTGIAPRELRPDLAEMFQ